MKTLLFLPLFILTITTNAQSNTKPKPITEWQPIFLLDSVVISKQQLYFDLKKLLNVNIDSDYYDSAKQVHGKVYLTSIDPKNYYFLTAADIAKKYEEKKKTPLLFMVDNDFLTDTTAFRIDSSYILKVDILKAAAFTYLKKSLADLTIIKIVTKTKDSMDKQKDSRLTQ